jgi:hypothetical protein
MRLDNTKTSHKERIIECMRLDKKTAPFVAFFLMTESE